MAEELVISVMLAVTDASAAVAWYKKALGATLLWDLGGVAGLQIAGKAFFVGEPAGEDLLIPSDISGWLATNLH